MDTQTVLTIIKMINVKQRQVKAHRKTIPHYNQDETQYWDGMLDGYFDLKQHLQDYIEARVSAMENRTEQ